MKILWICPFFLHPTDRGAQIRTLATLKQLHRRHEIHFAALNDPANGEGPARSTEYSSRSVAISHRAPARGSLGIIPQLLGSLFSPVPLAVSRYASKAHKARLRELIASERYDSIVCDFLAAAPNVPALEQCVLFQHNVETTIWQRHAEQSTSPYKRLFFGIQAGKMATYERRVCQATRHVVAVSEIDASRMKSLFGIEKVTSVPTGVDAEYFAPRDAAPPSSDMVFCGSMDWLPNVDAVVYFLAETLPLIRKEIPQATFTVAGRSPDARVLKAVEGIAGVRVTGSVDDMRPFLWQSKLSVVPIRIGGGTRLKIYECMAAGIPVVSTSIGAEGLSFRDGSDLVLADDPRAFAAACVRLLSDEGARRSIAGRALHRAQNELSWEAVGRQFEAILESNRLPPC